MGGDVVAIGQTKARVGSRIGGESGAERPFLLDSDDEDDAEEPTRRFQ